MNHSEARAVMPEAPIRERDFGDLVDAGIRGLDALMDYIGAILKLQGHRLARTTVRSFVIALAVYGGAAALALAGVVLVTMGAVFWIGSLVGSTAGGFFIVGGTYALAGIALAGGFVLRSRRSTQAAPAPRL